MNNEYFEFTIDTTKYYEDNCLGTIPFDIVYQNGIELTVNWGDGTIDVINNINRYTDYFYKKSYHMYNEPGQYRISINSNNWNNTSMLYIDDINTTSSFSGIHSKITSIELHTHCYDIWRRIVTIFHTKLPKLKGRMYEGQKIYPITSLNGLFKGCRSLTTIPNNFLENYQDTFKSCNTVTAISCFADCTSLQSIPTGLFDNIVPITSFEKCFQNCTSLQSIPTGLFDKNTTVTNFYQCFYGCSFLTTIPSGLFDKNTAVTDFSDCFRECTSLQSIPTGLFDKNTAVTDFSDCFRECTSLQSIPTGLFDKNTAVTTFYTCFSGCTSLQSIPTGLFDKNTRVTSFYQCFYNCTSLQSIPTGLFDKNTRVTSFYGCFWKCSSIQSIPSGLFAKNTAVTNFQYCFSGCTNLNGFTLNIASSSVTSADSFVTKKDGVTRIINVPADSTTYSTFNAYKVKTSLGLTIGTL